MIIYIGKQTRIDKGLSVRELAKKAGISSGSISKWENGIHLPDLETLGMVAVALGVKPWQLVLFDGMK